MLASILIGLVFGLVFACTLVPFYEEEDDSEMD